MLANEKLYEMKVPNNIVLNSKDGKLRKLKEHDKRMSK